MKSDKIETDIPDFKARKTTGLYESTNVSSLQATDNRTYVVDEGQNESLKRVTVHDEITAINDCSYSNTTTVSSVIPSDYRTELAAEDGHYDMLEIASVPDNFDETGKQMEKVKRLKWMICILTLLIIALTASMIFLIFANDPAGDYSEQCSNLTCGELFNTRTRGCANPMLVKTGSDCIEGHLQKSQYLNSMFKGFESAFSVMNPHSYNNIDGIQKLKFSRTIYQYGSAFNISTGTYNCSIPGVYLFSTTFISRKANPSLGRQWFCYIFKNLAIFNETVEDTQGATVSQSAKIGLNIGDTVYLSNCKGQPNDFMEPRSSFTGFLLYPTNCQQ